MIKTPDKSYKFKSNNMTMSRLNLYKKPVRRYSIDPMLVMNRIEKKFSKMAHIESSILKQRINWLPIWSKYQKNADSTSTLKSTSLSRKDIINQSRKTLKVHMQRIEFQEHKNSKKTSFKKFG